ncbi:helix-turn-helix domain-containing protein [Enterococcus sp. DIV1420a]|uniref:helix-turn-helix domain-containing protein n=1 Tax=Enterococcus sp. DIV1420a TaxID=2774672 RepID=UPI003F2485E7
MNRLKELRKEKNITLVELSEELDIPRSTLNRYENEDSEPKQETWEKIANYFKVSVGYLMGVSEQRVSDEYALKVAKKAYYDCLSSDKLSDTKKKALEYFNNENLDSILTQAMREYLTSLCVGTDPEWEILEKTDFLYPWLRGYLINIYSKKVKTNQNLIINTYFNIPSFDDIDEYGRLKDDIQIPIEKDFYSFFKNDSFHKEIEKLIETDTTLIAYDYETSIDNELKDDINKILGNARSEIYSLKEKYPDKPSKIEQVTILIDDDFSPLWSRVGSSDLKDELNLSETTKQIFIQIASEFIKSLQNQSKE